MLAPERQKKILEMLFRQRIIKISDIAEEFGVSNLTARRDLDMLQEQDLVRRVYGGAILTATPETSMAAFASKNEHSSKTEKEAIGKLAASMIEEGDTIHLGTGTTTLEIAKNIRHMTNLTIIVSSLAIINELANSKNTIYVLGGVLDPYEQKITGHATMEMLEKYCPDKAFFSCDGVSLEHGVTAYHIYGAEIGKIIVKNSARTYLVASSKKFGLTAMNKVCPLSAFQGIITDDLLQPEYRDKLEKAGIPMYYATTASNA